MTIPPRDKPTNTTPHAQTPTPHYHYSCSLRVLAKERERDYKHAVHLVHLVHLWFECRDHLDPDLRTSIFFFFTLRDHHPWMVTMNDTPRGHKVHRLFLPLEEFTSPFNLFVFTGIPIAYHANTSTSIARRLFSFDARRHLSYVCFSRPSCRRPVSKGHAIVPSALIS